VPITAPAETKAIFKNFLRLSVESDIFPPWQRPDLLHIVPAYIYTHQAYTIRKSNGREKLSHAGSRVPQVRIFGPGFA
jgi:hypothetical protein